MITFEQENKKIRRKSNVLIEKYRPGSVKQVILPARYKKMFNKFIEEGEIQNLILYSQSPGVGKTTIAKSLAYDCNYDYKYINTSLHTGIDTLRSEIMDYASVKTFDGKRKLIILDEFDFASPNLQAGMRGAIEEFYNKCRFIFTANNIDKIIKPLRSRCQTISFDFNDKDKLSLKPKIVKRLELIAEKEDIPFESGIMGDIVDAYYPDIRKMINNISEYSKQYDTIDSNIFSENTISAELIGLIKKYDIRGARKFILDNGYKYENLYRYMFDNLIPTLDGGVKIDLYKLTSEYLDMATRSWDQEITFIGYLTSIIERLADE